ncbi:MAG TPA: universal stress protein [Solirubrobacteraceae bacterium]|nr:universal stress protein [Solirubrobacteraceae bacterium]
MPVLICFDDSPSAVHALDVAARTLGDIPAVLLHVWNPPDRVMPDAFATDLSDHAMSFERLEGFSRERSAEILEHGELIASRHGLDVTRRGERCRSSVWQTVLEIADELDAELIVCGTQGATAVTAGPLGSVSNALVHHAGRPVLIVPDPQQRRSGHPASGRPAAVS